ncbi:MAG TPA: lipoyl synthase [Anaerolineae bacterium]|nr:lipoyl synthase [Anaerolineae bacterium]
MSHNEKAEHTLNSCRSGNTVPVPRKPHHLRIRVSQGPNYRFVKNTLRQLQLHTVCEEAGCPNIYECFESKTATFLILGDTCTRNCRFCLVGGGKLLPPDPDEPLHVAQAISQLGLTYAVITSVTRDDLPDGGASVFSRTIREIRKNSPNCGIEVLIPDFGGNWQALKVVIDAGPDVLNHNIETIHRLYPQIRPAAGYERSLHLLKLAKETGFAGMTKSGIMVGLGEDVDELVEALADLRHHNCDIVTIGQYLAPSKDHFPIARYYTPAEFEEIGKLGLAMGFSHVESGPLVRSSYHAKEQCGQAG